LIGFRRLNSKGNQGVFSTILHKKDADDFSPTSKSIEPIKSLHYWSFDDRCTFLLMSKYYQREEK
jgi:hypothetical protein